MFEQAFKNIDDVLRKEAGCSSELDYTEQTSWLLFLKYLDGLEQDKADEAELEGKKYTFILEKSFRWDSWAAPKDADGKIDHNKATFADFPKSWSVDAKTIDPTTFDLSVKNPDRGAEVTHRSPEEIMDEIAALDAESAVVLQTIRGLL
jgi:type I restriction-modification system DNA methylase subunit